MKKLFNNDPLEKEIEDYLRRKVKDAGGIAYKFSSPARRGVPDRMVILPNGCVCFVEVKRKGGMLTMLQRTEIEQLRDLGQWVYVVYS